MDNRELGRYIRRVRKERRIKQKHLAEACNKSPAYICDIEKGRRGNDISPIFLMKISEVLNVPISTLFEKAGIDIDENSTQFRQYLKLTRNRRKSQKLSHSFQTLRELIVQMKKEANGTHLAKTAVSAEITLNEIDAEILAG